MKIKTISIVFLTIIMVGCNSKQNELEYLIAKDSVQYWDYEWPRARSEYYGLTFSFDYSGNVEKYSYNKQNNKRWPFLGYPKEISMKWKVSNDSIFSFMGSSRKIIRYNEDTIYALDLKTKKNVHFIRVKDGMRIYRNPIIKYYETDSVTGNKKEIEILDI